MAAKESLTGNKNLETNPKKTSIGHGKRKRGSFKWKNQKKYIGQGK